MKKLRPRKLKDVALLVDATSESVAVSKVLDAVSKLGAVRERRIYLDTSHRDGMLTASRKCGLEVVSVTSFVDAKKAPAHIHMSLAISEIVSRKNPPSHIAIVSPVSKAFFFLPPLMPKTQLWVVSNTDAKKELTKRQISQINIQTGDMVPATVPSPVSA